MCCGLPLTRVGRDLVPSSAALLGPVKVFGGRHASGVGGRDNLFGNRVARSRVVDHELAARAVVGISQSGIALLPLEHW